MEKYKKTSSEPLWILMLRNTMISAFAGAFFGCLLFPLFTVFLGFWEGRTANFELWFIVWSTLTSPFLMIFIFPMIMPLIIVAIFVAVTFQKSITKHLKIWCLVAPFSVWLVAIGMLTFSPLNSYYEQFTWFERILINIPNPEHLLFLIAPMFSSFVFYKLFLKEDFDGCAD